MARAGVYFSDVKRARDAVVAEGRHPSIDAVRAALGNTGSKTTIHKYLREIEAEEGGQQAGVSDAIQALVTQLADQLKGEAATTVEVMRVRMAELQEAHEHVQAALESQLVDMRQALEGVSRQLASTEQDLAGLKDQLSIEQIARHTAEQRSRDLGERLADAERHQASLEEKHRHARDSLEHYRSASREQREQESRRHEQQVHGLQAELRQGQLAVSLKQEELTRLNKEAAALASELGANKQALHLERDAGRNLARKIEQLQTVESRVAVLEAQLAESRNRAAQAEEASTRVAELCNELRQQKAMLEVQLASANSVTAWEDRLAKLDKAVFGAEKPGPADSEAAAD
ncbi:DNA-binding protein [Massilia sp. CMS3.1]|uniref:DNA-binding protein n=1 Tax=Massilia sp. CMS3.1 TaxID=3373083 RepID=UPI003EE482F8